MQVGFIILNTCKIVNGKFHLCLYAKSYYEHLTSKLKIQVEVA
jgi:hypothetical protein